jgi:hypothetical protein
MENKQLSKSIIIGTSIVLGLFLLGIYIFKGFKTLSDKDRVVTVKGLAEMNMKATSATINLSYSFSGDDLKVILKQADNKKSAITNYLISMGYEKNEINIKNIEVTDREKYYELQWENGFQVEIKINRYTVEQKISINCQDIENTENKSSKIKLDLISKDLTSNVNTYYTFPDLNSIKPQLIAESTKNARIAGEQFANDSEAQLGKIKTASQGQISIAGQYYYEEEASEVPSEPFLQKARVVSTIVFFLD